MSGGERGESGGERRRGGAEVRWLSKLVVRVDVRR